MVRFRPTRLFRRLSSRGESTLSSTNNDTTTASADDAVNNASHFPSPARCALPLSSSSPSPPPPTAPKKSTLYSAALPKGVRKSRSLPRLRTKLLPGTTNLPPPPAEQRATSLLPVEPRHSGSEGEEEGLSHPSDSDTLSVAKSREGTDTHGVEVKEPLVREEELQLEIVDPPLLVVQQPTPDVVEEVVVKEVEPASLSSQHPILEDDSQAPVLPAVTNDLSEPSTVSSESQRDSPRPSNTQHRRPSIVDSANANLVHTLLDSPLKVDGADVSASSAASSSTLPSTGITHLTAMANRKIWVRRPGASATLVQIREDDLVDDVRDMILRKYANSLGKTFDAPDMTLSIASRTEHNVERVLGPEEEMCRTIDSYYPGGQTVHEALIINVPQRRTPRPSPKVVSHATYQAMDDLRPLENGTDYFPPMPVVLQPTIPQTASSHESRTSQHHYSTVPAPAESHPRSISVLNTGQVPPLPSPGALSRRHQHQHRPKYYRQATSSPTIISHPTVGAVAVGAPSAADQPPRGPHRQSTRPRMDSTASEHPNGIVPVPPALTTPPAVESASTIKGHSDPPTPSGMVNNAHSMNLHQPQRRPRKTRKSSPDDKPPTSRTRKKSETFTSPSLSSALESAAVPPINVLIVEDNVINLKILEGLMKRLKVRWQTAMNGQIAVDKYRAGGFHLVLMDIQMPVMNGLQATKEIRRLERVNGIGVFGEVESPVGKGGETTVNGGESSAASESNDQAKKHDKLQFSEGFFKSPVIIVALTASSLQSDRHEALAAGCNDFLTKPVNFVWLERKVKEWGCMQALIDYDGWRRWKDYAAQQEAGKSEEEKQKDREKAEKDRVKAEKMAKLQEKQAKLKEEREKEKAKRSSLNASEVVEIEEDSAGAGGLNAPTEALRQSGVQCLKGGDSEQHG